MTQTPSSDQLDLQQFGYKQQLSRSMGRFSSFAISFSLISIITGIFANFSFGIQQVGGAIIWSWSLVGVGQLLVALVMADLSVRFPISGYGYQWTSRLSNPHIGYFVGWLLLMQFITGFPGVCQALADTTYSLWGEAEGSWTVTWITVGIISLITLVHMFGIRLVTLVNDAGVYAEIVGVIFIVLFLWGSWFLTGYFDFSRLFHSQNYASGEGAGFSAFALSLLVGAWCLTGFEAAADLAEETHQPRRTVPRAILLSQSSAAVMGFLMIGGFLLSGNSIISLQQSANPLIMILEENLGNQGSSLVGLIIVLSIFACGVACMATATRLIYSMARDNMLPFSDWLKSVHPVYKTPRQATFMVWLLGCLFVIAVRHLELITSVSAVAGYLGYFGIILTTMTTKKLDTKINGFSLGKWRRPVQVTSLFWTALVVAALTIPANEVEGMTETHMPAKSTLMAIFIGLVFYFTVIKSRIDRGEAGPPKM